MILTILSLNKVEHKDEVAGLNVKTRAGEVTLLSGHRPMVGILEPCTAKILTSAGQKIPFEIKSGFLEMSANDRLNLLID